MDKKLNILSIGAGAIGTYFGGSLALKGHQVVFLERSNVAKELKKGSLKLNLNGKEFEINAPNVVDSLEKAMENGPYDFALFALKSFDTASALEGFAAYSDQLPPFLCLSNGVENEQAIAKALGSNKVIYGTVTTSVGRRGNGDIIVEKLRGVGIAKGHLLSERIAKAMDEAGLQALLYDDPDSMKWSKMLTNLIANASSAILDMSPAEIFSHPGLFYLEVKQLREMLTVMKKLGLKVVDVPKTPVKALALGLKFLPLSILRPLLAKAVGGGRGDKMPSFHIDLHGGRGKSEVSYLNGAVVRNGEMMGVPTPANLLLEQKLIALTLGHEKIETYRHQPEKLLSDL